ncbi:hypothetical protein LIA77_06985 [Sarocladium implicatum]|nr:hypothetical protein LIA77_06985 [Sarocladium implicatum]
MAVAYHSVIPRSRMLSRVMPGVPIWWAVSDRLQRLATGSFASTLCTSSLAVTFHPAQDAMDECI